MMDLTNFLVGNAYIVQAASITGVLIAFLAGLKMRKFEFAIIPLSILSAAIGFAVGILIDEWLVWHPAWVLIGTGAATLASFKFCGEFFN